MANIKIKDVCLIVLLVALVGNIGSIGYQYFSYNESIPALQETITTAKEMEVKFRLNVGEELSKEKVNIYNNVASENIKLLQGYSDYANALFTTIKNSFYSQCLALLFITLLYLGIKIFNKNKS